MLGYVIEHFEKYIEKSDVQETILDDNPVLGNIGGPKTIDDYLKETLLEAKKSTGTGARPKPRENPTKGFKHYGTTLQIMVWGG